MASMRMCDAMLPAVAQSFSEDLQSTATIVSGFAVAYGASQLLYGVLGDRVGKARVIVLALWGCAAAALLASIAQSLPALVLSRVLMGAAAGGVIPLSIATIADQVPFSERQAVLAKLLSYTLMGLIGGAWAGGFVADALSWRAAFVVMGVVFAAVGLGVHLRMARTPSTGLSSGSSPKLWPGLKNLASSAWSRTVLLTTFVEGAVVFGVMTFIPTLLYVRFETPLSGAGVSLAFFGLGGLLYTRVAKTLLAMLGQPKLAALGSALLALSFGTFAFMPTATWSLPACFGAGIGFYMLHNTLQTCATQLNTVARGSAVSLFVFLFFLGQSLGVTLEGMVIKQDLMTASHVGAAGMILLSGIFFSRRLTVHLAKG